MYRTSAASPRLRHATLAIVSACMALLCGCSGLEPTVTGSNSFTMAGTMSGVVHGGQQAVFNATVRLYAAGTTGYGSAGTLLATTTSDGNGNFQFTKLSTTGSSAGNTSTWQCPTANPDPQIYITAVGGNTQGTGVTTTNNPAAAFIAAIGPCSTVTTGAQVGLNEITTAATVFALAPFMSPGTTPGTESIGSNGANNTTTTPQGATGLNNAVASIANLANIATGGQILSNTYTGTAASVSGVTVTATPEYQKLLTIADILAACVNTASGTGACTTLFGAAVPPTPASITSYGSTQASTYTFPTAADTIQAAYYMAINPTDNTTAGAATLPATAGTNINTLFALVSSTSPFQSPLASQPSDWTIGVNFTATGNCTGGGPFFNGPAWGSVDATGDLWFINGDVGTSGTATTYPGFAELSPIGAPLACYAPINSAGRGITIDPTGNVWASFNGGATTSLYELPVGTTTTKAWNAVVSPYAVYSDGYGNIYSTAKGTTGTVYLFPSPGTNTTTFTPTLIASGFTSGANAIIPGEIDGAGRLWLADTTSATPTIHEIAPPSAVISAFQITGGVITFYSTATNITAGEIVNVTGLTTATGLSLDHQSFTVLATNLNSGTSFQAATTLANAAMTTDSGTATVTNATTGYTATTTALATTATNSYGMAVDSNGYVYVGDGCCGGTGASERTLFKITPAAGSAGAFTDSQSAQSIASINGVRSITLDGAANIWVASWFPQQGDGTTGSPFGISELYTTGSGTTATFTPISSGGTKPATCSTSVVGTDIAGCPFNGAYQKTSFGDATDMEVDPSGNVWVLNGATYASTGSASITYNGTSITQIIGAAVPIVTPVSVAAKNGTQATKP